MLFKKQDDIDDRGGCAITAFLSEMTSEGDESVPLYTYITLNYIYRGLKLKFDSRGFATCPDCGSTINCGTGGIQNLNVVLEAESHSSAINGARSRSSHDTCFWPYPPYSHEYGLSSSIIVAIACGGRAWPACTVPWNTTSNHTEAESSMQLGNKRKRKTQAIQEMHSGSLPLRRSRGLEFKRCCTVQVEFERNGCETKWVRQIASNISSINLTNVLVSLRMHTARKSAKELGLRGLFIVPERLRKTCTAMMSLLPYIDRCLIT